MDSYVTKETEWKNTDEKDMGLCDWGKGRVYPEEGKYVSVIKGKERRSMQVYTRIIEEGIY